MKPTNPAERHVVVLGASAKPLRYSNQAIRLLQEKGYRITPVHPRLKIIEGIPVAASLHEVRQPVDTLTLYVGPRRLEPLIDQVIALRPERVIFNPGTESRDLMQRLDQVGIYWLEACTLVLLRIGTF
ncbi:MAG: CoA-binding protein [Pseudomonadota bacterium]